MRSVLIALVVQFFLMRLFEFAKAILGISTGPLTQACDQPVYAMLPQPNSGGAAALQCCDHQCYVFIRQSDPMVAHRHNGTIGPGR